MKFKYTTDDSRELVTFDEFSDFLRIVHADGGLYVHVNDGRRVLLTKRRALALAKAIIEELS